MILYLIRRSLDDRARATTYLDIADRDVGGGRRKSVASVRTVTH
jgi:hypothetical protein